MRNFFAILSLALALSCCGGPQALAADVSDELSTQQRYDLRNVYADASTVPPVSDAAFAAQGQPKPAAAPTLPPANDNSGSIVNLLPSVDSFAKVIGTLLGTVLATLLAQLTGLLPGPLADWLKKSFKVQDVLHDIAQTDYAKKLITVGLTYVLTRLGLKAETLDHVDVGSDTVARVIVWLQEQEPTLITWIMSASGKTDETVPGFVAPIINQIIDEKKAANDNRTVVVAKAA